MDIATASMNSASSSEYGSMPIYDGGDPSTMDPDLVLEGFLARKLKLRGYKVNFFVLRTSPAELQCMNLPEGAVKTRFPLTYNTKVAGVESSKPRKSKYKFTVSNDQMQMTLSAHSDEERQSWMSHLEQVIQSLEHSEETPATQRKYKLNAIFGSLENIFPFNLDSVSDEHAEEDIPLHSFKDKSSTSIDPSQTLSRTFNCCLDKSSNYHNWRISSTSGITSVYKDVKDPSWVKIECILDQCRPETLFRILSDTNSGMLEHTLLCHIDSVVEYSSSIDLLTASVEGMDTCYRILRQKWVQSNRSAIACDISPNIGITCLGLLIAPVEFNRRPPKNLVQGRASSSLLSIVVESPQGNLHPLIQGIVDFLPILRNFCALVSVGAIRLVDPFEMMDFPYGDTKLAREVVEAKRILSLRKIRAPSDSMLVRFIKGHDNRCSEVVIEYCTRYWDYEQKYGLNTLHPDQFKEDIGFGVVTVHGFDREKRSIVWIDTGKHRKNRENRTVEENLETCTKFSVFYLDLAVTLSQKNGQEQYLMVVDVGGFGWKSLDFSLGEVLSQVLDVRFCERNAVVLIINAGLFFRSMWEGILPFLPAETLDKVAIIGGSKSKERLLQYIDEESLPSMYGGSDDSFTYSPLFSDISRLWNTAYQDEEDLSQSRNGNSSPK